MSLLNDLMRKGWLYQATGYTILISFLWAQYAILFLEVPKENRELFHLYIGIIDTAFVGNLVNFFYGSSQQRYKTEKKTEDKL